MINKTKLLLLLGLLLILVGCGQNSSESSETTSATNPADCFSNDQYTAVNSGSYTASQKFCYQNSSLYEYTNNTYDENGNLIYTSTYDNLHNCMYWAESEYDDNNNEVTKKVSESGSSTYDYYYESEYDSSNRLVRQIEYDNQEQIVGSLEYSYDGLTITENSNNLSGEEKLITETTNNESGLPLSVKIYLQDKIESDTEYQYDEHDNTVMYSSDGITYTYDNEYDDQGNLIEKITYYNNEQTSIDKFSYDNNDACITYDYYNSGSSESLISFNYEYDSKGNRTLTRNNTSSESTESTYNDNNEVIDYKVINSDGVITYEEKTFFYLYSDK